MLRGIYPRSVSQMIELTLPDMTCGHCVQTVTKTVQRIDPAARISTDLGTHNVRIEAQAPRERIVAALAAEGYPAQE
jgi:copper chaperone